MTTPEWASPSFAWHWAVGVGPAAAIVGLLYVGGLAALLQFANRMILWVSTPMPWNWISMLDDSVERGLMRRIGGGWMFRHETLQQFFADQSTAGEPPDA